MTSYPLLYNSELEIPIFEKCEKCDTEFDFIDKIYKPKLIAKHNLQEKKAIKMCSTCLVHLIVDSANRSILDL